MSLSRKEALAMIDALRPLPEGRPDEYFITNTQLNHLGIEPYQLLPYDQSWYRLPCETVTEGGWAQLAHVVLLSKLARFAGLNHIEAEQLRRKFAAGERVR